MRIIESASTVPMSESYREGQTKYFDVRSGSHTIQIQKYFLASNRRVVPLARRKAPTILSLMTLEQFLVQQFGQRGNEVEALRGLAGCVTATYLREAQLTPAAFDAVVDGLADKNPRVRWWCVQVLDHVPDPRAVEAIANLLDDPVPRVRRNAAHALGCVACKPEWSGTLPPQVIEKLIGLAAQDPNMKVRSEAAYALSCRV
jgi:hypothetical protein